MTFIQLFFRYIYNLHDTRSTDFPRKKKKVRKKEQSSHQPTCTRDGDQEKVHGAIAWNDVNANDPLEVRPVNFTESEPQPN